jgi:hypothetical protein
MCDTILHLPNAKLDPLAEFAASLEEWASVFDENDEETTRTCLGELERLAQV